MLYYNLKVFFLIIIISFVIESTHAFNKPVLTVRIIPKSYIFIDSTKAVVSVKLMIFMGEQKASALSLNKIFYINKNYFLEPQVNPHSDRKIIIDKNGNKITHDTSYTKLDSYRLTDVDKKISLWYNLKSPPQVFAKKSISDATKTDSSTLTIPLISKLLKDYYPEELQKEKDTVIDHHHCIIVNCKKEIATELNNQKVTSKYLRLIIDKDVKYFSLRMVGNSWLNHFGGIVTNMEQKLDNGITVNFQFDYRKLSNNENTFMNTYINIAKTYVQK